MSAGVTITGSAQLAVTLTPSSAVGVTLTSDAAVVTLTPQHSYAPVVIAEPSPAVSVELTPALVVATGGGSGAPDKLLAVDPSRPLAYAAYDDRIVRLDYATYPPATAAHLTAQPITDWPNRSGLTYA